jgi:hypothetical protein
VKAIREIKKVKNNKVTIELPKKFSASEVEIIVLPITDSEQFIGKNFEALFLSESALKKDWYKSEEDAIWKNL